MVLADFPAREHFISLNLSAKIQQKIHIRKQSEKLIATKDRFNLSHRLFNADGKLAYNSVLNGLWIRRSHFFAINYERTEVWAASCERSYEGIGFG